MKLFLFLVFSFVLTIGFSQKKIVMTQIHTTDVAVFQRFYQKPFCNGLLDINYPSFNLMPFYISLQHTSTMRFESRKKYYSIGTGSSSFMIPAKVRMNDSIKSYITGISTQLPGVGIDILYGFKKADILLLSTVEGGWVWLFGDQRILTRNAYLMPKVTIMPRFLIKKMAISCFVEYGYDITSKRWKRTLFGPKSGLSINSFRQSAVTIGVSIGHNSSR